MATVDGVTLDERADGKKKRKVTVAPSTAALVASLPTELPPAALGLLKEHLSHGIALER